MLDSAKTFIEAAVRLHYASRRVVSRDRRPEFAIPLMKPSSERELSMMLKLRSLGASILDRAAMASGTMLPNLILNSCS